ncbi:MAG: YIP1 family protein [Candidatus ainarchaeum sp.]|nr:YIP1 family protein [Candidatus ainarchaeum sp.]
MDIGQNVRRIKDNLLLIPEARFDELTKDTGYTDSFIYLVACFVLSVPIDLLVSLVQGAFLATLTSLPVTLILFVIFIYAFYGIEFLALRLLGGQASFLQSMQIFIYGSTGYLIFSSIPCIGFLLGLAALSNVVLGSARIHKISLARAIIALVLLPLVIIGILAVAIAILDSYFTFSQPLLQAH